MANFHPPAEMLMDYATGALREAPALVVATHLALCPACRAEVEKQEAIGGQMLECCGKVEVSAGCKDKVLAALDNHEEETKQERPLDLFLCRTLPAPLRSYVGCGATDVPWKSISAGIDGYDFPIACAGGRARLMRIKAGQKMPSHTHKGTEYTLVLSGAYRDGDILYRRGDMAVCDASVTHNPVADTLQDCICLVVIDGKLQLCGLIGRLLSPFVRL